MPTPYERIDALEQVVRELAARVEKLEKPQQKAALLSRLDAVGTDGAKASTETLHLPPKGKH